VSKGDLWALPGGHRALEVDGSTRDVLRLAIVPPGWEWMLPPRDVARALCHPLPMRYYGAQPGSDWPDGFVSMATGRS
jgi:hypothetical protein